MAKKNGLQALGRRPARLGADLQTVIGSARMAEAKARTDFDMPPTRCHPSVLRYIAACTTSDPFQKTPITD